MTTSKYTYVYCLRRWRRLGGLGNSKQTSAASKRIGIRFLADDRRVFFHCLLTDASNDSMVLTPRTGYQFQVGRELVSVCQTSCIHTRAALTAVAASSAAAGTAAIADARDGTTDSDTDRPRTYLTYTKYLCLDGVDAHSSWGLCIIHGGLKLQTTQL